MPCAKTYAGVFGQSFCFAGFLLLGKEMAAPALDTPLLYHNFLYIYILKFQKDTNFAKKYVYSEAAMDLP